MRKAAIIGIAMLLSGCATVGTPTPGDPYERLNRGIWGFNMAVDKAVLKPVTKGYRAIAPKPVRQGISHFFANLEEPFNALNNLLQGKPDRAVNSIGRFVINTTAGLAGLLDTATKAGLKPTPEDFGQTLAVWGVKSSAYLVLPILGPSTVRDGIGSLAAQWIDPYRACLRECNFVPDGVGWAATGLEIVETRSELMDAGTDSFLARSADPYAVARSAYLQRRAAEIADHDDVDATVAPAAGSNAAASGDAALDAALKDIDANQGGAAPASGNATTPAAAPSTPDAAQTPTAPVPGDVNPTQPGPDQTPVVPAPTPGADAPAAVPPQQSSQPQ